MVETRKHGRCIEVAIMSVRLYRRDKEMAVSGGSTVFVFVEERNLTSKYLLVD